MTSSKLRLSGTTRKTGGDVEIQTRGDERLMPKLQKIMPIKCSDWNELVEVLSSSME